MSFLDDAKHVAELTDTVRRVRQAWERFPDEGKEKLGPKLRQSREDCERIVKNRETTRRAEPVLALAGSALELDLDDFLRWVKDLIDAVEGEPAIDASGAVWGFGSYEQINLGWLAAFLYWVENAVDKAKVPFRSNPANIEIPNEASIAIVGDYGTATWGGSPSPPRKIRNWLESGPQDYFIHLGDVYYSGEPVEDSKNLVRMLPPTRKETWLTLNGNHDMYSQHQAGLGYFRTLLDKTPQFNAQQGTSYFSLENAHWIIVCLDSSYFDARWNLYIDGNLDETFQLPFLRQKAEEVRDKGKQLVVMTHHNGLEGNGERRTALWDQVRTATSAAPKPIYWYWGHVHAGLVYEEVGGIRPRVCGHSAIPWGRTSGAEHVTDYAGGRVRWVENSLAVSPSFPGQLNNGFAVLTLDGDQISEVFYDQDGNPRWSSERSG